MKVLILLPLITAGLALDCEDCVNLKKSFFVMKDNRVRCEFSGRIRSNYRLIASKSEKDEITRLLSRPTVSTKAIPRVPFRPRPVWTRGTTPMTTPAEPSTTAEPLTFDTDPTESTVTTTDRTESTVTTTDLVETTATFEPSMETVIVQDNDVTIETASTTVELVRNQPTSGTEQPEIIRVEVRPERETRRNQPEAFERRMTRAKCHLINISAHRPQFLTQDDIEWIKKNPALEDLQKCEEAGVPIKINQHFVNFYEQ